MHEYDEREKHYSKNSPARAGAAYDARAKKRASMAKRRRFWLGAFIALIFTGAGTLLYGYAMPGQAAKSDDAAAKHAKQPSASAADVRQDRVKVSGTGVIQENTAQGRLLARRAALTDVRRKLLELRQELMGSQDFKSGVISGHVPGATQKITTERIEDGHYFLEIEMSLGALAGNYFGDEITN